MDDLPLSNSPPKTPFPGPFRLEHLMLAAVATAFVVVFGSGMLTLPARDFEEYWSAGDVFVQGGNPYDPAALTRSLRAGPGEDRSSPTMMWNPPWTLPLTVPFALLPFRLSHLIWVAAQLGLVLVSVRFLADLFGGLDEVRGPLRAAALLFPPTVFLLVYGQIGGVCLFGLAGFLFYDRKDRPVPAGLCVALTAIKPHLLFAFGLFLLLEAVVSRRSRIAVLTGAIAVIAAAGIAWMVNPNIYSFYDRALNAPAEAAGYVTVRNWELPLGSYWLRMGIAPERFWIQFIPLAIVAAATPIYWWKTRRHRDWRSSTPVLVLASLLAAPYGGWLFDLVLLLVPIIHAAAAIARARGTWAVSRVLGGLVLFNLLVLVAMPALAGLRLDHYIWFTPVVLLGYVLAILWAKSADNVNRPWAATKSETT